MSQSKEAGAMAVDREMMGTVDIEQERKQRQTIFMANMGLLFVALFWGGGFVACKFALEGLDPFNLMMYRYGGAAIVTGLFCVKRFKKISRRLLLYSAVIGALMFLGNTLQTIGLQYTTPGKQSFIISLYTVIVPLLSWAILRIKPSKKIIAAAIIALVGISLLTLKDDFTVGFGDFLTFLFAITFSLQVIFIGIFVKNADAMLFTFLQIGFAAVFSILTVVFFGTPQNIFAVGIESGPLMALIYLITFNTSFAFMLQNICQRYSPPNYTAIILSSETVFGTVFAITLAGEVFRGRMILGCILMFAAIIIAEFPSRKRDARLKD